MLAKPFLKNSNFFDDGAALNFYDITAKSNFELNENNTLYISSYVGRDVFKFDARQGFNWGNRTGTVRWNHLFNDGYFQTLLQSTVTMITSWHLVVMTEISLSGILMLRRITSNRNSLILSIQTMSYP